MKPFENNGTLRMDDSTPETVIDITLKFLELNTIKRGKVVMINKRVPFVIKLALSCSGKTLKPRR